MIAEGLHAPSHVAVYFDGDAIGGAVAEGDGEREVDSEVEAVIVALRQRTAGDS